MDVIYKRRRRRKLTDWPPAGSTLVAFSHTDQKPPEQLTLSKEVTTTNREDLAKVSMHYVKMHCIVQCWRFLVTSVNILKMSFGSSTLGNPWGLLAILTYEK